MCEPCIASHLHSRGYFSDLNRLVTNSIYADYFDGDMNPLNSSQGHTKSVMVALFCSVLKATPA